MATPSTSSSSLPRINTLPPASSGRVTSQVGVRKRPGTPASSLGSLSGIVNVALGNPPKYWINTIKNVYSTSASELERLKSNLQRKEADLQNLSLEKNLNTTKLAQLNKELVKITDEIQIKNTTHSKLQADLIKLQTDSQSNSSLMLEDISKYLEEQTKYLEQIKNIVSQQKACLSEKTNLIERGNQIRPKIEELKREETAISNKITDLNSEISSLNRRQKILKFEVELFLPIANCGEAEKIDIFLNFRSTISGITKDKNDEKEEENTRSASTFSLSSSSTSSTQPNRVISPSSSSTSKPLLWQELPASWASDQLKSNEAEVITNKQQFFANETESSNIKKREFAQIIGKMIDLRTQLDYFNQCIDFEALCLQNLEAHIHRLTPSLNSSFKAIVEKELNEQNAKKEILSKNLVDFRTKKENLENGEYRDLTNKRNALKNRISILDEQNLKINSTIEALFFHAKFCQSIQDKMIGHSGIDVALAMNVESILGVNSVRQVSKEQEKQETQVSENHGTKRKEGPSTPTPASQTLNNANTSPSENNVDSTKKRKKIIDISSDEDDDNDNENSSSTTSQPIASPNRLKGRLKKISSSSEEDSSDSSSSSDDETPIIRRSKKIDSSDVDSSDSSSSSDSDDEKTPVNSSSTTPKITRSPAKKAAVSRSPSSSSSTSNSFEILRLQNRKRRIKVKCPKDAPEDLKLILIYNHCVRNGIRHWTGFLSGAMKVEKNYRIDPLKKKEKEAGPYVFNGKKYRILERPKDPEAPITSLMFITAMYNTIVKKEPNLSFEDLVEKMHKTYGREKIYLKEKLDEIFELASQNEDVIKTSKVTRKVRTSQVFEAFKKTRVEKTN